MGYRIDLPALGPKHWWEEKDPGKRALCAWRWHDSVRARQSYRESEHLIYASLYGSREMASLIGATYGRPVQELKHCLPYNIIRQCVDTRQSKICQSRPSPAFVTSGGTWRQRNKAKKLNKFRQALFYENRIYDLAPQLFLDSEIIGDGVVQVYEENGRVKVDRVLASEIQFDELEAKYGKPRQSSRVRQVAREVLRSDPDFQSAKAQEAIDAAPSCDTGGETFEGDMVDVLESWHIPSAKDSKDGWHAMFLRGTGKDSAFELWKGEITSFDFVFMRSDKPMVGFWCQPPITRIVGHQIAINKIYRRVLEGLKWVVPTILSPRSARVNKNAFTNAWQAIMEYDGMQPPTVVQASFIPKDLYQELQNIWERALAEMGVSEMDVSSQKPMGLNSGQAIREYSYKSTSRLAVRAQQYEQFFVDLSIAMVECARKIAERPGEDGEPSGYAAQVPNSSRTERIDWKEIALKEDEYSVQAWPTSLLSQTPEGRIDQLVEWMQLGLVDGAEFRKLSEIPDLEASTNIAAAALDDAGWTIDEILERGKQMMPEPYQDLGLLLKFSLAGIGRAKRERYPMKRIDNLRVFADNVVALMQPPAPPMAPAGPAIPPVMSDPGMGGGLPPPGMEPPPMLPGPMNAPPMAA